MDILFTALAFEASYQTRVRLPLEQVFHLAFPAKLLLLGFSVVVWVLVGFWLNLYDRLDSGLPKTVVQDTLKQTGWGITALVIFQYLLRLEFPLSRSFLVLFALSSWVFLCAFRLAAANLVTVIRRRFRVPHCVLVAGTGATARKLGQALEHYQRYGIRLLGFLAEMQGNLILNSTYPVHSFGELPLLLHEQVIDEIIFTVDDRSLSEFKDIFALCDEEGVQTRIVMDFFPHVNSSMYLDRLDSIPLLTFSAAPYAEIGLLMKRLVDVVLSAVVLTSLSPLMLIVALLVRASSPGPVIFRQIRCGLNGRRFTLYKFRSMCQNAEELKAAVGHLNLKSTAFKIRNDPRRTPLGRWLRKFSVDEWPQLWNVLKGDMSLVGPRPALPSEVNQYHGWQRRRLRMRPGLTCLWAIEGRDNLDFDTWMSMDMLYMDNWSLALDWKILLLTIPRVLSGDGAH